MNTKLALLLTALTSALSLLPSKAAEGPALTLEPYGTISWAGINGEAELGAGANLSLAITKNLSVVSFAEADNTDGLFVERLGAGLRYTAWLGTKVSLDGGVAGGYDLVDPHFFLRLPLGANLLYSNGPSRRSALRFRGRD